MDYKSGGVVSDKKISRKEPDPPPQGLFLAQEISISFFVIKALGVHFDGPKGMDLLRPVEHHQATRSLAILAIRLVVVPLDRLPKAPRVEVGKLHDAEQREANTDPHLTTIGA